VASKNAQSGREQELAICTAPDGAVQLDVSLRDETVWLSLRQLTVLFGRDKSVISRHLRNIFDSGELMRSSVVAKNATTAADGKTYIVEYFNLDAIISVGYRVNSKRGTQFRIWATQVLRQHLVQGYTIREQRLLEAGEKYVELRKTVELLSRTAGAIPRDATGDEARGLLRVLEQYGSALEALDQYDHRSLPAPTGKKRQRFRLQFAAAQRAIQQMAVQQGASNLFGKERGDTLAGILAGIDQTFDGKELYPTVEEKAAHLLYFIVKDHPFVDGNKRIGAAFFAWFLHENRALVDPRTGAWRFDNAALAALTLLVAQSRPGEKNVLVRLVERLLSGR